MEQVPASRLDNSARLAAQEKPPAVTAAMRAEIIDIFGADFIARHPKMDPANLSAYWANETPAYRFTGLAFEHYQGPQTWENAWSQLKAFLAQAKAANFFG